MLNSIEKAYFISKKEFLLLLGIAGAGEVYSFELPRKKDVTSEDMINALYQLARKGFIKIEDRPVLNPDILRIMEIIRYASLALTVNPKSGNQRICYFDGERLAAAELCGDTDQIRIGCMSGQELWEELTGEELLGRTSLETENDGLLLERYDEQVRLEREALLAEPLPPLEEPHDPDEDSPAEKAFWERFDLRRRCVTGRYRFRRGTINSWILCQEETGIQVLYDSQEERRKLFGRIQEGRQL
ncbi:MAG: hypothetical protein Q4F29_00435 [Lachnospiraceae bacterium]|nr:hypothetical protein [Lachnospiraceae bacterium]